MTSNDINVLYEVLEETLNELGFSYKKPGNLAKNILEASSYFIQEKGVSPWQTKEFQGAYIAHFLPMNIFRWFKAFERMEEIGKPLMSYMDFGAGPLTFRIAHFLKYQTLDINYDYIEKEKISAQWGEKILTRLIKKINTQDLYKGGSAGKALVLSYSLNELQTIPSFFWSYEDLIILEPSTQNISRNLLKFREMAIEKGYQVLAPCLHSLKCPMLHESKKDWCFDRTSIELPLFVQDLYKVLPFDTHFLTFSYLWLTQRKEFRKTDADFRMVGDWQKEKGKDKIMVCRSEDREFLSILKKDKASNKDLQKLQRGELLSLGSTFEKKGNELRLKKEM